MRLYEGLFAFPPNVAPEDRKNQEKGLENMIVEKFGGKILEKTELGKRSFGYEVKKYREGLFVLLVIEIDPVKTNDFRKALELNTDILKYLITQKETVKEVKPSRRRKIAEKTAVAG